MLSKDEIIKNYCAGAKSRCGVRPARTFVLAILAGMFIAFAGLASQLGSYTIANPSICRLVSAMIFPAGLIMVVIAGSELFTGNCLLVMPLASGSIKLRELLLNLGIVYLGNLLGGLIVSALAVYGNILSLYDYGMLETVLNTATAKCSLSPGVAIIRGIGCNLLVCISVWMALGAKNATGKIAALYTPVMIFVLAGFEHSIANMYYLGTAFMAKSSSQFVSIISEAGIDTSLITLYHILLNNLLPVTIGNIIGGAAIGLCYYFCEHKN